MDFTMFCAILGVCTITDGLMKIIDILEGRHVNRKNSKHR